MAVAVQRRQRMGGGQVDALGNAVRVFDGTGSGQLRHEELIDAEEQQDQGDSANPAEDVVVQRPTTVLAL